MDFENVEIVPDTLKSEFDPSPFDTRHEIPYNSETFADEEDECYLPSPSKKIIRRDVNILLQNYFDKKKCK